MAKNVVKLTESQKQLCGCEPCIMVKEFLAVFNYWNTNQYKRMVKEAKEKTSPRAKARALQRRPRASGKPPRMALEMARESPSGSIPEMLLLQ